MSKPSAQRQKGLTTHRIPFWGASVTGCGRDAWGMSTSTIPANVTCRQCPGVVVLTQAELDLLRWAVDGAESAHHADPEEFPAVPDFEDLEYRIAEQAPEAAETSSEARRLARTASGLISKLNRTP